MVVAEALAHGVPVIASRRSPWMRVEEVGCGLWVDNGQESLASAIRKMSGMPLVEMGRLGRRWMEAEFSWDRRADEMIGLYRRLSE
jgi:glycosyltransferase involved in cell wall biosynthesis